MAEQGRRDVAQEMAEKERARDARRTDERLQNPAYRRMLELRGEPQRIWVRPRANRLVSDLAGGYIPSEGVEVSASNVYIARRIRDGALEVTEKPAAKEPAPEQAEQAEPPAEQAQAETPPPPPPPAA